MPRQELITRAHSIEDEDDDEYENDYKRAARASSRLLPLSCWTSLLCSDLFLEERTNLFQRSRQLILPTLHCPLSRGGVVFANRARERARVWSASIRHKEDIREDRECFWIGESRDETSIIHASRGEGKEGKGRIRTLDILTQDSSVPIVQS